MHGSGSTVGWFGVEYLGTKSRTDFSPRDYRDYIQTYTIGGQERMEFLIPKENYTYIELNIGLFVTCKLPAVDGKY